LLITFYCADLPASPVHVSESLNSSKSFPKQCILSSSDFTCFANPQAQLPESYLCQITGKGSAVNECARFLKSFRKIHPFWSLLCCSTTTWICSHKSCCKTRENKYETSHSEIDAANDSTEEEDEDEEKKLLSSFLWNLLSPELEKCLESGL
jgi:hypothetical protein